MIKMNTSVSAVGFDVAAGQITDKFTKEEEKRYVDSGLAEYVNAKKTKTKNKK